MSKYLNYTFDEILFSMLIELSWHEISHLILRYGIYNTFFAATPIKEKIKVPHL